MAKQNNPTPQTGGTKGQVRDEHRIGDGEYRGSYQPTKDIITPPPSKTPPSKKKNPQTRSGEYFSACRIWKSADRKTVRHLPVLLIIFVQNLNYVIRGFNKTNY